MDYIVIKDVPPYDGRWEFDMEGRMPNTREWGWIKRVTGYLPQEIEGKALGDPELLTVFALIALTRAGKSEVGRWKQTYDQLAEVPFGEQIVLESEEQEADAGPPPGSSSSNGDASGPSSSPSSETSPRILQASGTHGSVSSVSTPPRSAS